jgi:amino acid adenylation domain-containing protein/thioester reductase-like protein
MLSNLQDASIVQLFENQVERTPNAIALIWEEQQITYRELNEQANQLAHYLQNLGVGLETLVGICVERSPAMIIGILGILKAGGAYVPLDPAYPQERLAFMLEDSQVPVLLTQNHLIPSLPKHQSQIICLDTDWSTIAQHSLENPTNYITPDNLAYIIYTSGSTGQPKGVCVIQRGVVRLVQQTNYVNLSADEVFLQLAPISFDASTFEIWGSLLNGALLAIMPAGTPSLQELGQAIARYQVTTLWLTAGLFHLMVDERLQDLKPVRQLLAGGDVLSVSHIKKVWQELKGCQLINGYGPTENTTFTCCYAITDANQLGNSVPIGSAIANTQVYLLDAQMQPVKDGASGELYVGGAGLAREYLNRPDLTAEKFVPNPFSNSPGGRLYKTGDLGRYLPDGSIDYLGRIDQQVKIRGFRIELGEIESLLWQHPTVKLAAVADKEDASGNKQLVAYIVPNSSPDRVLWSSQCLAEFDWAKGDQNYTTELTTEDISIGGVCLVGVPDSWELGKQIRLRLQLPATSDQILLAGTVAWRQEHRAGIQFAPTPNQQVLLQQNVDYLLETKGFLKVWQRTIVGSLRSFLKEKLPNYMMPSSFVLLNALPLTPNGKVDRKALPKPKDGARPELAGDFVAPRTPVEEALVGIWAEVLKLDRVGIYDNFLELGGNSLRATQVMFRVWNKWQVELPLRSLLEASTVAKFAQTIETTRWQKGNFSLSPLKPIDRNQNLPVSFGQEQLWFLGQRLPNIPVYNEPSTIRLHGSLKVDILEKAFRALINRHEILRTNFVAVDGQLLQIIQDPPTFSLPVVNLQDLPVWKREAAALRLATLEAQQPFDLTQGLLLRTTLIQLDETDYRLFLTLHHIIFDGVSLYTVLFPELEALYQAFDKGQPSPLPALTIQYADFAVWQRQWLQKKVLETNLSYWQQQLAGITTLQLPTDRPRSPIQRFQGARECLALPKDLTEELRALSRREGVTLFVTLLAAFKTLLYRYSNQDDIVVGTVSSSRNRPEIEGLMGYFLNTLVLRTDLSGSPSFRQLLSRVRSVTLEATAHEDLPFQKLVEVLQPERNLSQNPLFQVAFVLEPALPSSELGWSLSQLDVDMGTAKFDLYLELDERPEGIIGRLEYNTDLFDAGTIRRMLEHYQTLLTGIVRNPEQRLLALPLLGSDERRQLAEWNHTQVDYPDGDAGLHQLFELQAGRSPTAIAAIFDTQHLTYQDLNARANQLANYLRSLGVNSGMLVGICVERSLEMVVGLLAILKAGGAYVPLDPNYPPERLSFMLEHSQATVLLAQQHLLAKLPKLPVQVVCLDTEWGAVADGSTPNYAPDNLAYVIYTSGSTGQPKGVAIAHRGAVNTILDINQRFGVKVGDRVLALSSLSFDLSVYDIFGTLAAGGTIIIPQPSANPDPSHWGDLMAREQVTIWNSAPALMQMLVEYGSTHPPVLPASLRLVMLSGDWLPITLPTQLQALVPDIQVVSLGGATEASIWSILYPIHNVDPTWKSIPYGRPMANQSFFVLNEALEPCPVLIKGHLYIGGIGLAQGYWRDEEKTQQRFIIHPRTGERLYCTGDLGRYLPDGNIEFLGRIDHQVKLRGFRIELGEIEAILGQHPDVREAVLMTDGDASNQRLIAYIVSKLLPDRVPLQVPCLVEFESGNILELTTEDISAGGIRLVGIPATCNLSQQVRVRLQLPVASEPQWLTGNVVWCQEEEAGVQLDLSLNERSLLQQTVDFLLEKQGFLKVWQRTITGNIRSYLKEKLPSYMIPAHLVLLSALPLTPNGKIDRRILPVPQDQTPSELEQTFTAPRTPTEEILAKIWADLLNIEQVGIDRNFFELGGHSLLSVKLLGRVKETFQVNLPLRSIFEHPTVASLAAAIDLSRQLGVGAVAPQPILDLNAEVVLDPTINPHGLPLAPTEPNNIFLTGATGFLGAFLLQELLEQTQANIYCLVRSANVASGKAKIQQNLERYLLWQPSFSHRIVAVLGDLSQPFFGLTPEEFQHLAAKIDVIYHSGAIVNFLYPYSTLKAPNVLGTEEVLRLASQIKVKPIHFISTVGIFASDVYKGVEAIREEESPEDSIGLDIGYSQSKWVAEKLVAVARDRGMPVSIYRPGRISGDARTGVWSTTDFLCRIIKGCIQMEIAPELNLMMDMTPVNYVSSTIVHLSKQKSSLGKSFHLVNHHQISWQQIINSIADLGYPLQQIPAEKWHLKMLDLASKSPENALHPLVTVFATGNIEPALITLPFSYQNTLNGLLGSAIACPRPDAKLLDTYFSYFIRTGFLDPAPAIIGSFT